MISSKKLIISLSSIPEWIFNIFKFSANFPLNTIFAKILIRLVLPQPVSPINIVGISQLILSRINIILIKLSGVKAYSDNILLIKSIDNILFLLISNNSSIN